MAGLYGIEAGPEVRYWLTRLSNRDFGRVDFHVGLLAEQAENLCEPYTRHLGGKDRELRLQLLAQQTRATYWRSPGRRVTLLPHFRASPRGWTAGLARALRVPNSY